MTIHEGAELHQRVERYEAAVAELRAAHRDVKDLLLEQVLFDRWQQLGAELGFSAAIRQPAPDRAQRDLGALAHQIPEMSDSWAS